MKETTLFPSTYNIELSFVSAKQYTGKQTHIIHEPQKDQYCYHDCKLLPEIRNPSYKNPYDLSYFILLFIFVLSALNNFTL